MFQSTVDRFLSQVLYLPSYVFHQRHRSFTARKLYPSLEKFVYYIKVSGIPSGNKLIKTIRYPHMWGTFNINVNLQQNTSPGKRESTFESSKKWKLVRVVESSD